MAEKEFWTAVEVDSTCLTPRWSVGRAGVEVLERTTREASLAPPASRSLWGILTGVPSSRSTFGIPRGPLLWNEPGGTRACFTTGTERVWCS